MSRDIRNVSDMKGYWTAELHAGPAMPFLRVHRRYGSWMSGGEDGGRGHGLLAHVCEELQDEVNAVVQARDAARKRELLAAAESGRIPAAVKGASPPASLGSNGSRVPSRLSSG